MFTMSARSEAGSFVKRCCNSSESADLGQPQSRENAQQESKSLIVENKSAQWNQILKRPDTLNRKRTVESDPETARHLESQTQWDKILKRPTTLNRKKDVCRKQATESAK